MRFKPNILRIVVLKKTLPFVLFDGTYQKKTHTFTRTAPIPNIAAIPALPVSTAAAPVGGDDVEVVEVVEVVDVVDEVGEVGEVV